MFKSINRIKKRTCLCSKDSYIHDLFNKYFELISIGIKPNQFVKEIKNIFDELYNPAIFPLELNLRQQIIDEITLFFLIQLLYEETFSKQKNTYINKNEILYFELINPNKEESLQSNKKIISYNYKKAEINHAINKATSYKLLNNYSSTFKKLNKKFINTFTSEVRKLSLSLVINNSPYDYLNIINIPYLRFLIMEFSNVNLIYNKICSLNYDLNNDTYKNTVDIFASNYNQFIHSSFDYSLHFFSKQNLTSLYIFIYTLYINTKFFEIANISHSLNHNFKKYSHILQYENSFSHTFKTLKSGRIDLNFDEDMEFYHNYITTIFKIHYSPTLCVELIKNPPNHSILTPYLIELNEEYDYCISHTYKIIHKYNEPSEFLLRSIDYFLENISSQFPRNNSTNIIEFIRSVRNNIPIDLNNFNINDAIIGNSFTGLCFFVLKNYYLS